MSYFGIMLWCHYWLPSTRCDVNDGENHHAKQETVVQQLTSGLKKNQFKPSLMVEMTSWLDDDDDDGDSMSNDDDDDDGDSMSNDDDDDDGDSMSNDDDDDDGDSMSNDDDDGDSMSNDDDDDDDGDDGDSMSNDDEMMKMADKAWMNADWWGNILDVLQRQRSMKSLAGHPPICRHWSACNILRHLQCLARWRSQLWWWWRRWWWWWWRRRRRYVWWLRVINLTLTYQVNMKLVSQNNSHLKKDFLHQIRKQFLTLKTLFSWKWGLKWISIDLIRK